MLDKMKALFEMQKKMQEIKRQLENASFEVQSRDGSIKITMNGVQEVKEVAVKENLSEDERQHLAESLKDTFNRALKRSQEMAASKMKDVTGINLPGLV